MKVYTVNSIETLTRFILETHPDLNRLNEVLWYIGIRAIILDDDTPEAHCELIKAYWDRWSNTRERPIFIGVNIDIE